MEIDPKPTTSTSSLQSLVSASTGARRNSLQNLISPTPRRNSLPIILQLTSSPKNPKTPVERQRAATRPLRQWFLNHLGWPYPDQHEKNQLSQECGPNNAIQIGTWFTNTRNRSGWLNAFKALAEEDREVMEELVRVASSPTECKELADHVMEQLSGVVKKLSDCPSIEDDSRMSPESSSPKVSNPNRTKSSIRRKKTSMNQSRGMMKKKNTMFGSPMLSSIDEGSGGSSAGDFSDSGSESGSSNFVYTSQPPTFFNSQDQQYYQYTSPPPPEQRMPYQSQATQPHLVSVDKFESLAAPNQFFATLPDIEIAKWNRYAPTSYDISYSSQSSQLQPAFSYPISNQTSQEYYPIIDTHPYSSYPVSMDGSNLSHLISVEPQGDYAPLPISIPQDPLEPSPFDDFIREPLEGEHQVITYLNNGESIFDNVGAYKRKKSGDNDPLVSLIGGQQVYDNIGAYRRRKSGENPSEVESSWNDEVATAVYVSTAPTSVYVASEAGNNRKFSWSAIQRGS